MAYETNTRFARPGVPAGAIDEGLRSYMLSVFNYMGAGLAITGLVAYLAAASGIYAQLAQTPLIWVVILAPLGFVFFLSARLHAMSVSTAQIAFWAFAAIMGLSLSYVFLRYTGTSVARVFFITAATFGSTALWGYTTKRDLTGMGSFMFMGLIGIVIAGLVNLFLQSSALQFAISVIGVVVFTGLTAWDTQRIKQSYNEHAGGDSLTKSAIMGALSLYLNFINMFVMMLQLFGQNRE